MFFWRSSAPDSRMNKMEGMRFTRNRQKTRSFGKFLAGNPTRPPAPVACAIVLSQLRFCFQIWKFRSKWKFRVFCYSQTGIRIARIAPKECTLSILLRLLLRCVRSDWSGITSYLTIIAPREVIIILKH